METVLAFIIVQAIFLLIPAWRIFSKAGFSAGAALLVLIPYIGPLIATAILAFAEWPRHSDTRGAQAGGP